MPSVWRGASGMVLSSSYNLFSVFFASFCVLCDALGGCILAYPHWYVAYGASKRFWDLPERMLWSVLCLCAKFNGKDQRGKFPLQVRNCQYQQLNQRNPIHIMQFRWPFGIWLGMFGVWLRIFESGEDSKESTDLSPNSCFTTIDPVRRIKWAFPRAIWSCKNEYKKPLTPIWYRNLQYIVSLAILGGPFGLSKTNTKSTLSPFASGEDWR